MSTPRWARNPSLASTLARSELRPQRQNRRMFQQQQSVADPTGMARFDDLLLQSERRSVVDAAEMDEVEDHSL